MYPTPAPRSAKVNPLCASTNTPMARTSACQITGARSVARRAAPALAAAPLVIAAISPPTHAPTVS
jgi:hypothetical protein